MDKRQEKNIRVLLVEDHTIVREGLRALLERQADIQVVGEVADGREALDACRRLQPDVAIMDLSMPRLNGVEATAQLRREVPRCRVLVLSMHSGEEQVRSAIRAGASGYLVKGAGLADLVAATRAVAAGEAFFSPVAAKVLLDENRCGPDNKAETFRRDDLTHREREIIQLVAEGHSSRQIAEMLHISPKTVEGHRARVMEKLGIHDLAGLVRYAVRIGLVSTET